MADEKSSGIQNKWLLIIALVLGALVVLVYNAHIRAIRSEKEGQYRDIVEMTKDLKADGKITRRHIAKIRIPAGDEKAFRKVIPWKQRDWLLAGGGRRVNQAVKKGEYLLWDHVMGGSGASPAGTLGEGMVAIPLEFDASQSLGDMLSVGDRVNLKGVFSVRGGPLNTYRMIEAVRVLNVGGRGASEGSGRGRGGMKSYRKITIEVSEDVSLQLSNLFSHMQGEVQLELRSASNRLPINAGEINPALANLAQKAKVSQPRGSGVESVPAR